ncbi:hypothetical protein HS088_TW07G00627 [Tripterygium wilfordii]|uniref:Nitrate regulatory gene2 protein-like n=1 Tax=Tripterygium wilfordii TaxID=458696 RepID=A0A7J7DG74_TRIWF|nr:uncharacterized protein LOC120002937 [Tripterygium wilfordii]KAF5745046.1 hypothetical protein HS088_TW07G00627 [Tripterygium wilfordii]
MGIGLSKWDNSPLLSLCKERKEFIKAAIDCRYDLASAHIMYLQSLVDVGNAFTRFIEEDLVIKVDSNHESSEENSHSKIPSMDSESDLESLTDYVHSDSDVSEGLTDYVHDHTDVSEVLEPSFPTNQGQDRVNSNTNLMKSSTTTPSRIFLQTTPGEDSANALCGQSYNESGESFNVLNSYSHSNLRHTHYDDGIHYDVLVESPYKDLRYPQYVHALRYSQHDDVVSAGGKVDFPDDNVRYASYGNWVGSGAPTDFLQNDGLSVGHYSQPQTTLDTSIPLMPNVSAWNRPDLFNVTGSCHQYYYYSQDRIYSGSDGNDSDLISVRKKEGIPDLENENQEKFMEEVSEEIEIEDDIRRDSGGGTSEAAPAKTDEPVPFIHNKQDEIELEALSNPVHKSSATTMGSGEAKVVEENIMARSDTSVREILEEEHEEVGGLSSDVDIVFTEHIEPIGSNSSLNLHCTWDIQEIMKGIGNEFGNLFDKSKELSGLLEAGKLPYQPMRIKLRVFASQILNLIIPAIVTSSSQPSYMLSNGSSSRSMMMEKANGKSFEDLCCKFGDLSSTLEELYAWEKKLFKEVMAEEKLRVIYEKKCNRLKNLDDMGADSSKIDRTHASIKTLLLRINVIFTSIDAISARIQKLRDTELHLQLNELIQGSIKMWSFMIEGHQKQLRAAVEAKTCAHIGSVQVRKDSGLKATLKLEKELLNWSKCFSDYVRMQKAFVKFLNDWLLGCIFQEPAETPNASNTPDEPVAFSPSRIDAPPIFIVCNDWYQATKKISESEVCKTIQEYASSLHHLWEKKEEECRHRLKAENLFTYLEKQMKNLHKESKTWNQDATPGNEPASACLAENGVALLDGFVEDLMSTSKRLDEQKRRHQESVEQVNGIASSCLQEGLTPILAALESFCSDIIKAYGKVRLPDGHEGSQ